MCVEKRFTKIQNNMWSAPLKNLFDIFYQRLRFTNNFMDCIKASERKESFMGEPADGVL